MSTYSEKLKDPRWQKKRLEILERDCWKCRGCGAENKQLQVHHTIYESRKKPWEHESGGLRTLCVDCHTFSTEAVKVFRLAIADMIPSQSLRLSNLISYAVNYYVSANNNAPMASGVANLMARRCVAELVVGELLGGGILQSEKDFEAAESITHSLQ